MIAGLIAPLRPWLKNCASAAGTSAMMPTKDDQRDTVADAACGDLLTQPHQEHRAADQRDHRRGAEIPAGISDEVTRFQADG